MSLRSKIVVSLLAFVGLFIYLIVMDMGINAGRIHYGVNVDGLQVGGQTLDEAMVTIKDRGRELRDTPVVLTTEGFDCSFLPRDLEWRVRPLETAERARRVGFDDAPLGALKDRVAAWLGGVTVDWAGNTHHDEVNALIDECERQATGLGLTIERFKLRKKINRAIVTWPRKNFTIPIAERI
jgi:hypothetical protein